MTLSQKTRSSSCHSYSDSWWASEGDKIYDLQNNFVGEALEEASRPFRIYRPKPSQQAQQYCVDLEAERLVRFLGFGMDGDNSGVSGCCLISSLLDQFKYDAQQR